MTSEEFDCIVDEVCENMKKVLKSKASDYASDTDRLHNFKVAARIDQITPEEALWGMAKKHLVSIMDIKNGAGMKNYSPAYLREKFGDMRNYLVLLEALMIERNTIPESIMSTAKRLHGKNPVDIDLLVDSLQKNKSSENQTPKKSRSTKRRPTKGRSK